jgi:hypothetical protein
MSMNNCFDAPLEPPEGKNDARITLLLNDVEQMDCEVAQISLEKLDVKEFLGGCKHVIYDHIKAIMDRYDGETARLNGLIKEYRAVIEIIKEGLH